MKFNICDKVVLTYDVDDAPEGTIGIICGHYYGCSYNYAIYLPFSALLIFLITF